MSSTFVDTSAILALLDRGDTHHAEAASAWNDLAASEAALVTTNYVVVETIAVLQHRLGLKAVREFVRELLPLIDIVFVDPAVHAAALGALLAANRRHLSLVDCASFDVMRHRHLQHAFAFDRHFGEL